jgi:hypothetical protein
VLDEVEAEGFDEGRLADSRRAGDSDPHGTAGARQELADQRLGARAVIGPRRLDERDRTRKGAPVTGHHGFG